MTAIAYRFGTFELQPDRRQLLVDGRAAPVGQRALDLLLALIERRDRLVSKHELLELVWPGLVVEENNLQVQVSALRKLLGPQAIATIPGRGYRFTAELEGLAGAAPPRLQVDSGPLAEAARTNAPRELPTLYGRDAELKDLIALVEAQRLVTIVGAGGIGKSRLAQALAHATAVHWPDGAWMVELAGLSDPALLPNAVAQALEVKTSGTAAAADELVASVAQRNALLILDNCEHLLAEVASLVQALAQGAPNLTVLTTSQEPLRLPTEQQYRVMPLAVPLDTDPNPREFGALALFEARVRAVDPRFALNSDNLAPAIDICRRLDGLPLAIELAAARVATLGLRPVRERLDARFKLLTGGSRATLRRHQTLRAALEWSYGLLDDDERTVFRRLGAFAGGFTVELAQAVAADAALDEWTVLDKLSALVDKSLVSMDDGDVPRYRLLESARAFALEQLAAGTDNSLERHARAMRTFIESVDNANVDGELRTDQYAALVLPELDNLRAAYAWAASDDGDLETAVALAAHCGSLTDYAAECGDWLLPLGDRVERGAVGPGFEARYWRALAATNMAPRVARARQLQAAERACALYQGLGRPRRVFWALLRLATFRRDAGDEAASHAALDQARKLVAPDWPAEFRMLLVRRDAYTARAQKRYDESLAFITDAIGISVAAKDWRFEAISRAQRVDLLWEMGRLDAAAHEARTLFEELRVRPTAPGDMDLHFTNLMGILSEIGDVEGASAAAAVTLPLIASTRNYYLDEWVHVFWRRGQLDLATLMLGRSDAQQARRDTPRQPNEARLIAQARAALEAGMEPAEYASRLAAGAALRDTELIASLREGLAESCGRLPKDPA